jgi:hypothetical protein
MQPFLPVKEMDRKPSKFLDKENESDDKIHSLLGK